MTTNIFQGLITAIITPFKDGQLDFHALEKILRYQIDNKVDGVVVAGSTGEGNSLSFDEYRSLIQTSVAITSHRIPVIAGCSSNNTFVAMSMAEECAKIGASAFMATVPSYVKPTQEGLYKHFESIHNACDLPIMLYSVPSRTSVDFTDETILRLSMLPRIRALKDADRDSERPLRIRSKVDSNFNLLSGNDEVALSYNAQGGVGCISVAANIVPNLCKKLQDSWNAGNAAESLHIQQTLLPLYKALFAEANPIPVKYAAHFLGLCSPELRLPLTEATGTTKAKIREVVDSLLSC